jgi:hypothetical protein
MAPGIGQIVVTQQNPANLTALHDVSNPVVLPSVFRTPPPSFRFMEKLLTAKIQEFLFRIEKDGSVFWVGVAVPKNATNLTRAQVYFHPTVVQHVKGKPPTVHAADTDYRDFKGGWSGSIQRYVAMQGGQLAGADELYPLLVPFTTMAAIRLTKDGTPPAANMFRSRPVETLSAVMQAIGKEIKGADTTAPLSRVGAASFSSGTHALKIFLRSMERSGLVKEIFDFDGPDIATEPKTLILSPGAFSKTYTQFARPAPPPGWVTLTNDHFARVTAFRSDGLHAQIGWTMYHQAMLGSILDLTDNPF